MNVSINTAADVSALFPSTLFSSSSIMMLEGDYSLIANEGGSFLVDQSMDQECTIYSSSSPVNPARLNLVVEEDEQEVLSTTTRGSENILDGLSASTFGNFELRVRENERDLLAASTMSYRGYRDSPRRSSTRREQLAEEEEEVRPSRFEETQEGCKTPRASSRRGGGSMGSSNGDSYYSSNESGSGSGNGSGAGTGNVNDLIKRWKGREGRTGEM